MNIGIYHRRLHKLAFYLRHAHLGLLPHALIAKPLPDLQAELAKLPEPVRADIRRRTAYYNRLTAPSAQSDHPDYIGRFRKKGRISSYYYDLQALLRHFPEGTPFDCLFGDVIHVPPHPALVKSRPIAEDNQNSVLLKLDSVRHFYIYPDPHRFADKKDQIVWRGAAHQPQRLAFLERFHSHPLCEAGCVHPKSQNQPYHKAFLSVEQQLRYRYILSIEGNDVATNLKWILASQSLCFMPRPKYETWLMEGLLQPEIHYVELADDYADFDEKLNFYRNHPAAAQTVIRNANQWMQRFADPKTELLTQLLVLQKYFEQTIQAA